MSDMPVWKYSEGETMTAQECPVCNGRGLVPPGFYDFNPPPTTAVPQPELCRSCGGCGIVYPPSLLNGCRPSDAIGIDWRINMTSTTQ